MLCLIHSIRIIQLILKLRFFYYVCAPTVFGFLHNTLRGVRVEGAEPQKNIFEHFSQKNKKICFIISPPQAPKSVQNVVQSAQACAKARERVHKCANPFLA